MIFKNRTRWAHILLPALSVALPVQANDKLVSQLAYTSTPAPSDEWASTQLIANSHLVVTDGDGDSRSYPLRYKTLFQSGDMVGLSPTGIITNIDQKPIRHSLANTWGHRAQGPFFSNSPDANSLIFHTDTQQLYLINHYEHHPEGQSRNTHILDLRDKLPMTASVTQLQPKDDGMLEAIDSNILDTRQVKGLWKPSGGALTPWNTHIGGEIDAPDGLAFENTPFAVMNLYLDHSEDITASQGANPYRYGYKFEINIDGDGNSTVQKRYAMGRLSSETATIMPDERTAVMGDNSKDGIIAMFVADRAGDLSSGSLYALKWQQLKDLDGGVGLFHWVYLGHASDHELLSLIEHGTQFSDIFDVVDQQDYQADPSRFPGYRPVYTSPGHGSRRTAGLTYLKLKPGMEKAAAFLETRRYAAYLGATSEFSYTKEFALNAADKILYMSLEMYAPGMTGSSNGPRPQNHITLKIHPKDLDCGALYQITLQAQRRDASGNVIDSDWIPANGRALLTGTGKPTWQQAYGKQDSCDTDHIANPGSLSYAQALRTLFIGEDGTGHLNGFLWAYQIDTHHLTRIMSVPAGGAVTGVHFVDDINGTSYLLANIQHPASGPHLKQHNIDSDLFSYFRRNMDTRGIVGHLQGFPAITLTSRKQ